MVPVIMILLSLRILTLCFVKIVMQLSLQSCLIDMSDSVTIPFRMLPFCACWDIPGDKGTVPVCVVFMSVPFAEDTVDP